MTFKNERTALIKNLSEGMLVSAKCWLNGREKEGKHFIALHVFDLYKKRSE